MQILLLTLGIGVIGLFASAAVSVGAVFGFLACWVIAMIGLGWVLTIMAKRQVDFAVSAPPQDVENFVYSEFRGMGWKEVDGRGKLNFRSRGLGLGVGMGSWKMEHPVVSISFEELADGSTGVSIWMSQWTSRYGQAAACDRVVSKRWSVTRKLAQFENERRGTAEQPIGG